MSDPRNPHGLAVGQRLWLVPHDRRDIRRARWVTVTAMKRKWAELQGSRYRLDIETLQLERSAYGYGTEGTIWKSRDEWVRASRIAIAWHELATHMRERRPHELVTEETLFQAATLLGLRIAEIEGLFKGAPTFDDPA